MKVLVIGSGGREHALVMKIHQSPKVEKVFAAPGSDAIAELAECVNIKGDDVEKLADFAKENEIDLTMVGPEDPLVKGVVDIFKERGLTVVGPSGKAALLEGSKAFSKNIMEKYNVPTAKAVIVETYEEGKKAVTEIGLPVVIKADGLAAGKGVLLCYTDEEADDALKIIITEKKFGDAGSTVVVEKLLEGEEASFIAFTDGKTVLPLASSQDHKRALDNDEGLNTGGMGAYSPAPAVTKEMHDKIMEMVMLPTVEGMASEGTPFSGVLYAGVMIQDGIPYVLEFNARFGDPETQPILSRMKSDLVDVLLCTANGTLDKCVVKWDERPAVCVVMASGGYPGGIEKGNTITGLDEASALPDTIVYHAGTKKDGENWVNVGGRVLGVTALGTTIEDAIAASYKAVEKINWKDVHYRKDIAKRALGRM